MTKPTFIDLFCGCGQGSQSENTTDASRCPNQHFVKSFRSTLGRPASHRGDGDMQRREKRCSCGFVHDGLPVGREQTEASFDWLAHHSGKTRSEPGILQQSLSPHQIVQFWRRQRRQYWWQFHVVRHGRRYPGRCLPAKPVRTTSFMGRMRIPSTRVEITGHKITKRAATLLTSLAARAMDLPPQG